MLEYFTYKKFKNNRDKKVEERAAEEAAKAQGATEPKSPILNDEDEAFLERITSEGEETPPPLPARPQSTVENGAQQLQQIKGKDAQTALMDGAEQVPLPQSPPAEEKKKRNYWAWASDIPKRAKSMRQSKATASHAADLHVAAETVKKGGSVELNPDGTVSSAEAKKEEQDLSEVLDQLNLAAVNNRVFSFSKESQELLEKFKQVLKDLVNGAPHAYRDLESLLTNSEQQLDKMFGSLPPFLQNLVKQLPTKMTAVLAPEVLAAAAEKPDAHLKAESSKANSKSAYAKKHAKGYAKEYVKTVPSLRRLVSEQGAIAALLRSILNFLKLRFPAVVSGTNVLMSLAVFILLFVFWYCHKRGREVRLEAEAAMHRSQSSSEDNIVLQPGTKPPGGGEGGSGTPVALDEPRSSPDNNDGAEPAITIHEDQNVAEGTDSEVLDLPSVLDLPDPKSVPLPEEEADAKPEGKGKEPSK